MFWKLYLHIQKIKRAKVKAVGKTLSLLMLVVAISKCL